VDYKRHNLGRFAQVTMAIQWRDEMTVDGGIIDADHKCLIALINDVDVVQPGAWMRADLAVILERLGTYARVHFEREERLQIASGFTYAQAHRSRHRGLMREFDAIAAECKTVAAPELVAFQARVGDFLYNWLRDHIIKVDLLMKPFVAEMQRHAPAVVALADAVRLREAENDPERLKPHRQLLIGGD
jgi:hemerythrin